MYTAQCILASGPINAQRRAIDARADLSKEAWRFRAAYQQRKVGSGAGIAGALDPNARGPRQAVPGHEL